MTALAPDRRIALGLLAGGVAGGVAMLSGCGPSDSRTTLQFWAMGAEATKVGALMTEFERRNPDIRVVVQAQPWTSAHQKLLTAYAGASLPDLSQVGNTWIGELTAIGALSPVPPQATDLLADQFDAVLGTMQIAGRPMATPWYVDTRLIYYRSDLLQQAGYDAVPQDWAEWKRSMHAIKRVVGEGNYAILLPVNEFEQLQTLGLQGDDPLLKDDETRGNFASPSFVAALAFYKSLFDEGLAPLASSTQISNVWTEFGRGYFSYYFSGPWTIGDMKSKLPATVQSHWNTAGIPGPKGAGASAPGGSSLAVFRSSDKQSAAWKLIRYLSEPGVQATFNAITGDLPARRSAWAAPQVANDPYIAAFKDQLTRAKPLPKAPEWERISTEMQIVAERMVRGEYTPETAGVEINRRTDRLLEKRRWMIEQGRAT
ncbi:sugar ABC transporter substrate-binding protein [soil metagenome]